MSEQEDPRAKGRQSIRVLLDIESEIYFILDECRTYEFQNLRVLKPRLRLAIHQLSQVVGAQSPDAGA